MTPASQVPVTFCIDHLRRDGAQRWLVYLAGGLKKKGFDVSVISLNDEVSPAVVRDLESEGISVIIIGRIPLILGVGVMRVALHLYRRRRGAVISVLFFSDILGVLVAKLVCLRCIIRAVRARNLDYKRFHWGLHKVSGRLIDAVVFVSESVQRYEEDKLSKSSARRFVVWNSIPSPGALKRSETVVSLRERYDLASSDIVIGLLGRLALQKNISLVLRALAKAARSDITALIAGDGEHREDLERLSKELGLSKQVHFIGYQQDAPGFLLEVDVLISASRFEGQPNAVLEAIAVGCPLLLSDIPEHQETLSILLGNTNLEPLLFKDDSVEDLAEKLETIHERIQVLREYATLMHSRASVLSLDRMISGWVDVLAGAGISSPPADGK